MSKLFINIEALMTIDRNGALTKNLRPFLILAGYLGLGDLKVLTEKKYENFSGIGHAIALFYEELKELKVYKKQRNKKLILSSLLAILLLTFIALIALEIKMEYLIKHKYRIIILYCLIVLFSIVLLYTILNIIKKIVNILLENRAISKQLEQTIYVGFQCSKVEDAIKRHTCVNEAIAYKTIDGKMINYDIQYLYTLYYELCNSSDKDKVETNNLYNYLLLFLEKEYLKENVKRNCKELLSQWRFKDQSIHSARSANDNIRNHNVSIAKQIIYQLFDEISCYIQYTSIADFIRRGILNMKSKDEEETTMISSSLRLTKLQEFETKSPSRDER